MDCISKGAARCMSLVTVLLAFVLSCISQIVAVAGIGHFCQACYLLALAFAEAGFAIIICAGMAVVYGPQCVGVVQAMQFSSTRVSVTAIQALQALHMACTVAAAANDTIQMQKSTNHHCMGFFKEGPIKDNSSAATYTDAWSQWAAMCKNSIADLLECFVVNACSQCSKAYAILCTFAQSPQAGDAVNSQLPRQTRQQRRKRRQWGRRQWELPYNNDDDNQNINHDINTNLPSWAHDQQVKAKAVLSIFTEWLGIQEPTTPQATTPQPTTPQQQVRTRRQWGRKPWDVTPEFNSANTNLPRWATDPVHAEHLQATAMKRTTTRITSPANTTTVSCKSGTAGKKTVRATMKPQWRI